MTEFDRCYSAHQKTGSMFVLTVDYFRDDLKAPSSSLLKLSVCCLVCQAGKVFDVVVTVSPAGSSLAALEKQI